MDRRRQAEEFRAAGDLRRAEAVWRAIVAADPEDPDAIFRLAVVRLERGVATDAAELAGRAATLAPHRPDIALVRADASLQARRPQDALSAAAAAVALAPGDPAARAMQAMVQERTNDLDAAAATIAEAELHSPADVSVATIAGRIARRRGDVEGALARFEALLERSDLLPFQRQVALHERATTLEVAGRHEESWPAFVAAGRAVAEDPLAQRLDRTAWPRRIAAYRRGLSRELLDRVSPSPPAAGAAASESAAAGAAPPSDLGFHPVFLVGFPRSGTTMTESILAAHPSIRTTDEQPLIHQVKRSLAAALGGTIDDVPALLERLTPSMIASLRRTYAQRVVHAIGPGDGESVLVDKLPLNLVDVGLIDAIFPDARLLVALRDPRDVCLSCFQQWFGLNTAMIHFLDPQDTVRFYATVMDGWLLARDIVRLPRLEVRYEDTTADVDATARRIIAFLGLDWDEAVIRFQDGVRGQALSTPSYAAVSEPVHRRAVARWRRHAPQLASWQAGLQPFVSAFGYEDDDPSGTTAAPVGET